MRVLSKWNDRSIDGMFVFWNPCARAELHQRKRARKLCSATLRSLLGNLSTDDDEPRGRRPEVEFPLTALVRTLDSSTKSSGRQNAKFAFLSEREYVFMYLRSVWGRKFISNYWNECCLFIQPLSFALPRFYREFSVEIVCDNVWICPCGICLSRIKVEN